MAERRMISKKIVDTDMFLDMPMSSRLLYYDLLIRADDDGFVGSPKKITKMIGASDDDFRVLASKRFIIPFETGVCVIRDWYIHNYIKSDRYQETRYLEERAALCLSHKSYEIAENEMKTECLQNGSKMVPQVRLGKSRLGKGRDNPPISPQGEVGQSESLTIEMVEGTDVEISADLSTTFDKRFFEFWTAYPKKIGMNAARKSFLKINPSEQLLKKMLSTIEAAKKSREWQDDDRRYIPNPAKWLQQGRWNDEIHTVRMHSYDIDEFVANSMNRLIKEKTDSPRELNTVYKNS